MDIYTGNLAFRACVALALSAMLGAVAAQSPEVDEADAADEDRESGVLAEMEFSSFSGEGSGSMRFTDLRFTYGNVAFQADQATRSAVHEQPAPVREWRLDGNIRIGDGSLSIESDAARFRELMGEERETTGLEQFELAGGVRLSDGAIRIRADAARLVFRGEEVRSFELEGEPVTFENLEPLEHEQLAGGADRLSYDAASRRVGLLGNAWLRVNGDELVGCDFIYDARADEYSSGAECEEGFRIRIVPREEAADADDSPPAP